MKNWFDLAARHLLFRLEPERAHRLALAALSSPLPLALRPPLYPRLAVTVAGIDLPNPLGIAAGFDKNAQVPDALLALGFGFVETGTVTPRPQEGNPKPRIFRLEEDQAIINRLGFNNEGHEKAWARLKARTGRGGIVGVNIGANRDASDRIADYAEGVRRFASVASYLTLNVSSPNTPGLRDLQAREQLAALLSAIRSAREDTELDRDTPVPIFLKISPDLAPGELEDVAEVALLSGGVDGLIVSNTTTARTGVTNVAGTEAGGLAGRPLFERSTIVLARLRQLVGPGFPLIGLGGVESGRTALEKIKAGADLVQLYTGFVYGGPTLPGAILAELDQAVEDHGAASISELRDTHVHAWAERVLE